MPGSSSFSAAAKIGRSVACVSFVGAPHAVGRRGEQVLGVVADLRGEPVPGVVERHRCVLERGARDVARERRVVLARERHVAGRVRMRIEHVGDRVDRGDIAPVRDRYRRQIRERGAEHAVRGERRVGRGLAGACVGERLGGRFGCRTRVFVTRRERRGIVRQHQHEHGHRERRRRVAQRVGEFVGVQRDAFGGRRAGVAREVGAGGVRVVEAQPVVRPDQHDVRSVTIRMERRGRIVERLEQLSVRREIRLDRLAGRGAPVAQRAG